MRMSRDVVSLPNTMDISSLLWVHNLLWKHLSLGYLGKFIILIQLLHSLIKNR